MEKSLTEFYLSGTHELWLRDCKGERKFLSGELETVKRVNGIMKSVYPNVYDALADHYSKYKRNRMNYEYKIAARFIRCNQSEDDMSKCDLDGDKLNLEQTKCPLKGSGDSPFEGIVCNPKPSGFTPKQEAVVKLYARGFSIGDIAAMLGKSVSTINNQLWRVKKKFNLDTTRDIILLAYFLNVV